MKYNDETIEKILLSSEKPGRYSGGERNQIIKNDTCFKFVISYPDMYEIGMANNGIKIIYEMLNKADGILCERVFAPAKDFYENIKNSGIKLFTLETRTPLYECDMIGFNYSHELLATNILYILDSGGVPLRREDRTDIHPIVMIGGECASNPLPLSGIADIFFIGEAEDNLTNVINYIIELKQNGLCKKDILSKLRIFDNLFIPGNCSQKTYDNGFTGFDSETVNKAYKKSGLDYPQQPLVPLISISQEKCVTEIARGCRNMCCFCHAGFCTLPYREYSPEDILLNIKQQIKNTGLNEVTLSALSVSDHTNIDGILNAVMPYMNENAFSISLPSMKVDKSNIPLIKAVSEVRQSSITFAVETADDYLRRKIYKKLSMNDLYEIIDEVFKSGWNLIKLYFMIGLPGFTEIDEADSIISALNKINDIGRRRKKINVTISPFVPKPHTPFENEPFASRDYLLETVLKIKRSLPKNISIKNHDLFISYLEAIFSRADSSFSDIIIEAYERGAVFDSWDEFIQKDIWQDIIIKHNLDRFSGSRSEIPWNFVKASNRAILDYKKNNMMNPDKLSPRRKELILKQDEFNSSVEIFKKRYNTISNYRLIFSKKNTAKYFSHNDMLDHVRRAFTSSSFPVSYTQGFNKHEKISASFPIPLGIESEYEIISAEVFDDFDEKSMFDSINKSLPAGLFLNELYRAEKTNLMRQGASAVYKITNADFKNMRNYLESDSVYKKESKGRIREIIVRDAVISYEINSDCAIIEIICGTIRLDDFIYMFGSKGSVKCVKIRQNI